MSLQLEQSQKQILSQKMIQSMNILQMTSLSLAEYIQDVSMENPLLDFIEPESAPQQDERLKKLEWLSTLDEQNRIYYQYDRDDLENDHGLNNLSLSRENTLEAYLNLQLLDYSLTAKERAAAEFIIQNLDAHGFCNISPEDIASGASASVSEAEHALSILQSLEPTGIASSGLQDCLFRQLIPDHDADSLVIRIVLYYLDLVAKNQLHVIARREHVSTDEVASAVARIRSCNPYPAQGFDNQEMSQTVVPDIVVAKFPDRLEILLNDYSLPPLRLNQDYLQLLRSEDSPEVRDYLNQKLKQIEDLQENIRRRGNTLLSLANCIVDTQREFFMNGERSSLKPFRHSDAAAIIDCHESTISRAVHDKYLQCCYGTFPLSFFFPKGISQEDADSFSVDSIKQRLADIMDHEDKKKPYSDQQLTELLNRQGIDISRRTVAKYREAMNYPSGRGRKVF